MYITSIGIISSGKKNNSFVTTALIEIYLLGGNSSIFNWTSTNVCKINLGHFSFKYFKVKKHGV